MARGIQRERAVRLYLEEKDYVVVRAAGSLGCADLVALKAGTTPMLLEIKSTARGPYAGFPPAKRADLKQIAEWAGADAWLVHWPPRGKPAWIPAQDWPPSPTSRSPEATVQPSLTLVTQTSSGVTHGI